MLNAEQGRFQLYKRLVRHFNEAELNELCLELSVDYEDLPGRTRNDKARELITHLERRGKLTALVDSCAKLRPTVSWDQFQSLDTESIEEPLSQNTVLPNPINLIGRAAEMREIISRLHSPSSSIICITGLGGIGKTALAQNVYHSANTHKIFSHTVWTSAKVDFFVGDRAVQPEAQELDLELLINEIVRQTNLQQLILLPLPEKKRRIQTALKEATILLVIDNAETIKHLHDIVYELQCTLKRSKILITSRHQFEYVDAYSIVLRGLSVWESVEFLRNEGNIRGIDSLIGARNTDLESIASLTGGAPLAMKLIAGQLRRLPLNSVLERLKNAKMQGENYEFYRFVYNHTWGLLSNESKHLLISMAVLPPLVGWHEGALEKVSKLNRSDLVLAVDQLVRFSLIDFVSDLGDGQYMMHPLTHYFLLSDIVEIWK